MEVFLVERVSEKGPNPAQMVVVGVYTTEALANQAIGKLLEISGSGNSYDYHIAKYKTDEEPWVSSSINVSERSFQDWVQS